MITQWKVASLISIMKIQYHLRDIEDFLKKNHTSIYNKISKHKDYYLRTTVWQGKDYHLTW